MKRLVLAALIAAPLVLSSARAQDAPPQMTPDQSNIVYGMVSGTALLMDVYHPELARGVGIVVIPGSGWYGPPIHSAPPLKDLAPRDYIRGAVHDLTEAGFTVFVINHRSHPGFRFPDPVHDARRSVRFVRANADAFGIDPDRIGILGHSSGANLAAMVGVMDDAPGNGLDPIDQTSAAVQAVVTLAAPFDLTLDPENVSAYGAQTITSYVGEVWYGPDNWYEQRMPPHVAASPVTHVDAEDPPFLIVFSPDDPIVPPNQAARMAEVMGEAGAPYEVIETAPSGHDPVFPTDAAIAFFAEALDG
ncbi:MULTISPECIES: alpha/beta hydrolase [Hyphobacterium]|uniref:Alpha/beta fold hydrolase n=1 Tax=Hyphobacterium vulgare TaxID=1736751 RepID=A0ABV6ZZI7_9PROT